MMGVEGETGMVVDNQHLGMGGGDVGNVGYRTIHKFGYPFSFTSWRTRHVGG